MSDLYLTPTRIALMQAIARGEVWQSFEGDSPIILEDEHGQRKVTSRVNELDRAKYAYLSGGSRWRLTAVGLDALAEATAGGAA